jgi:post-segregation antitoxin (ccd killing protein)
MERIKYYKEILFGFALGAAMWLIDAVMHAELGADVHAGSFWSEVFAPHPTALIFRSIYLAIAVSFGFFLWRANWRERQLRALEQAVIAFQRQLDAPTLRILGASRQLQNRNSIQLDETAGRLAAEISLDVELIDELAKKYLEFSRLVQAGETARAIETLSAIESWLAEQKSIAKL